MIGSVQNSVFNTNACESKNSFKQQSKAVQQNFEPMIAKLHVKFKKNLTQTLKKVKNIPLFKMLLLNCHVWPPCDTFLTIIYGSRSIKDSSRTYS